MAFGRLDSGNKNALMSEINMVPLIDVMLVLLIIFMITAPLMTNAVKLDLPKAEAAANVVEEKPVIISVTSNGSLYLNNQPTTMEGLKKELGSFATKNPQPEVQIMADEHVNYGIVAQTLAATSNAGLTKVGMITDPRTKPAS